MSADVLLSYIFSSRLIALFDRFVIMTIIFKIHSDKAKAIGTMKFPWLLGANGEDRMPSDQPLMSLKLKISQIILIDNIDGGLMWVEDANLALKPRLQPTPGQERGDQGLITLMVFCEPQGEPAQRFDI